MVDSHNPQHPPSSSDFLTMARSLSHDPATRPQAREICFRGLNSEPRNALGRLLLARLFYLDGLGEFCVRELAELQKYAPSPALDKLLDAFGEYAKPFLSQQVAPKIAVSDILSSGSQEKPVLSNEKTIAELELDFEEAFSEMDK